MGPSIRCLHHFFEEQATLRPDAEALVTQNRSYHYREVEDYSNRIARFLRISGVASGGLVGLYFYRSELPIIAMLGILKAGAGYVPIDPAYPDDRIRHILADASVSAVLTETALGGALARLFSGTSLILDKQLDAVRSQPAARMAPEECPSDETALSYIVYTSGSTGKPKGVMTEHRNIVSFVNSFRKVCALTPRDRVYQGFSLGFDGSVEEIWMAFASGAALVVGNEDIAKLGTETARYLTTKNVTYFSTVPTFLSMIKEDLPTVKTLVVSGEACPQELVDRWAANGRRMLNVYGPTETTVNATAAECRPNKAVTIGRPLDGYEIYVLDEDLRPVSDGALGELYIGGPGLSRGYRNLPDMTARAFVPTPPHIGSLSPRLYRTGDLVSRNPDGELAFFGRIDLQVKIRGYRIELTEIESVLREHPSIDAAAVTAFLHSGIHHLAAFVVARKGKQIDRNDVLALLKKKLPAYMVPAYLDELDGLPKLTSGKTDRKRLPGPSRPLVRTSETVVLPATPTQRAIAAMWLDIFKVEKVSIDDDFFMDLGGYSLLAAEAATAIRVGLQNEIAIRDIYQFPTVRALAAHCDGLINKKETMPEASAQKAPPESSAAVFARQNIVTRWSCFFLQGLSIALLYGAGAGLVLFSLLIYFWIKDGELTASIAAGMGVVLFFGSYPFMLSLSIIAKWSIIGKFKPGKYPLWSFYYFRWWLVTRIVRLSGASFLAGTPLMSIYYRCMGAKIGKNCVINTPHCLTFDLMSVGNDTCIGFETQLFGYRVENGMLWIGSVSIGDRCFVGIQSAFGLDCSMADDSRLDDLSLLPDNGKMAAGECRRGSPAQPADVAVPSVAAPRRPNRFLFGFSSAVLLYALEAFFFAATLPTFWLLYRAFKADDWLVWCAILAASILSFEMTFWLLLIIVKKTALGKSKPGTYPVGGLDYMRKWFTDALLGLSRLVTLPLYTTLYAVPLLRMLGLKIGPRAELSVISYVSPDLVDIGSESFFADGSIIGGMRLFRGSFTIGPNRIGTRSFVGNSAILPTGTSMGDHGLIGVLSAPPEGMSRTPDATEWLGSPSFNLPNRKKVGGFDDHVTYAPTKRLYAYRLFIDALRVLIPSCIEIAGFVGLIFFVYSAYKNFSPLQTIAALPFIGTGVAGLVLLCTIVVKNIMIGKYEPVIKPLWSPYVWKNEVINGVYESIAAPLLAPMTGTPFFPFFLKMFGAAVGKHTFIETTLFGEFDLVDIGDFAALNFDAIIQNHLFEDRIFKSSRLKIGSECSVGNMAVVLYDTEMQRGSSIGPLSLFMKGDTIQPSTRWEGIPIKRVPN